MNASTTIPATVQIKRGRLLGLVIGVAVLTAALTWVLTAYAFENNPSAAAHAAPTVQGYMSYFGPHPTASPSPVEGYMSYLGRHSTESTTPVQGYMSYLGQHPSVQTGPSVASVLASMGPATRRYTRAVMNLTFAQLKAGAAGHP